MFKLCPSWSAASVYGRAQPHPAKRLVAAARTFTSSAPRSKQRLVILGSGWGGYEILRAIDKKRWSSSLTAFMRFM